MQPLPFNYFPLATSSSSAAAANPRVMPSSAQDGVGDGAVVLRLGSVSNLVDENAVIVFCRSGCCMSHVIRGLLVSLGVNPTVYEVDVDRAAQIVRELDAIRRGRGGSGGVQFPVVCIGGRLLGGLDKVMAMHISGELVPTLKQAGALWL